MSRDIGWPLVAIAVIGVGGYFGVKAFSNHVAKTQFLNLVEEAELPGTVVYDSIQGNLSERTILVTGFEMRNPTGEIFTMDRIHLDEDIGPGAFESAYLLFENVRAHGGGANAINSFMQLLGYSLMELEGTVEVEVNADTSRNTVEIVFSYDISNVGSLSGGINFANLTMDNFAEGDYQSASLVNAEIIYEDDSFMSRIYDFLARSESVSVGPGSTGVGNIFLGGGFRRVAGPS